MAAPADKMTIEAELRSPIATAQILSFDLAGPADNVFYNEDVYWIDLCLTTRMNNARARYSDHWGPHRFEKVGPVCMMPRGQEIQFKSDGGRQSSIVCLLKPEPIAEWLEHDMEWTNRRLEASLDMANANLRQLLRRLSQEMRFPGLASDMLVEMITGQIAIELGRFYTAIEDSPVSGGLAAWRLRLIDERLAEIGPAPTLSELAALCNLSVRQLTRGFRASRSCSIGDYVAQSRVDTAKRLLADEDSIKAIARAMGFASPSSFSYAFRRSAGVSPRQFRTRVLRRVS